MADQVQKIGSQVQVSSLGAHTNLATTTLADGSFVVAWDQYDGPAGYMGMRSIVTQEVAADGTLIGSPQPIESVGYRNTEQASLSALQGGGFAAAFADPSGTVEIQVFAAGGNRSGCPIEGTAKASGGGGGEAPGVERQPHRDLGQRGFRQ